MKPPAFEHLEPASVAEALELLDRHADSARPLAGGQSLVPLMNLRLAAPEYLIDLNRIGELAYVRDADGGLAVGAMTRQRTAERSAEVLRAVPLLAETLHHVGHFQIRNRGTIGGSLAHADPAADLGAALLALDGNVTAESASGGPRTIGAGELFESHFSTTLAPNELLTRAWFPKLPARTGWSFQQVARRTGDFALVGVAVVLRPGTARIALCGIGATPVRATAAEHLLLEGDPDEERIAAVAERVREEIDPGSDIHASADYRRYVAGVLTRRALHEALVVAAGGEAT